MPLTAAATVSAILKYNSHEKYELKKESREKYLKKRKEIYFN